MDILKQFSYVNRKVREFGNTFGRSSPEYLQLSGAMEMLIPDELLKTSKGGYQQLDKSDMFRVLNDADLQERMDALTSFFENFGGVRSHANQYLIESGQDPVKDKKEIVDMKEELQRLAQQETIREGITDSFYILLDTIPNKDLVREIKDSMSGSVGKGNIQKQWEKYDRAFDRLVNAMISGEAFTREFRMKGEKNGDGGAPVSGIFQR